jgi:hypothetical protein
VQLIICALVLHSCTCIQLLYITPIARTRMNLKIQMGVDFCHVKWHPSMGHMVMKLLNILYRGEEGVEPDDVTFCLSSLSTCSHAGLVHEGLIVLLWFHKCSLQNFCKISIVGRFCCQCALPQTLGTMVWTLNVSRSRVFNCETFHYPHFSIVLSCGYWILRFKPFVSWFLKQLESYLLWNVYHEIIHLSQVQTLFWKLG